eukprot:3839485-Amphidinium_carterae.1
MERAVRTDFMPNPSKGSIKGATEAIFGSVGTLLEVSVALSTEAGLQTTEIRTVSSNCSKQGTRGVPLDFVVSFTP